MSASTSRRSPPRGCATSSSIPVGFVSDHVEILFDIDRKAAAVAAGLGVRLERPPALNDDPRLHRRARRAGRGARAAPWTERHAPREVVVVVGGGIAGLAAARRLESLAPDARCRAHREATSVLGGKIRTERVDGFVVEAAPDSFLARKERGIGLCEELGLGDELIGRRPEHRGSFVRRGDELHPLPEGLTGMIPTSLDGARRRASSSRPRARRGSRPSRTCRRGRGRGRVGRRRSCRAASAGRRTRRSSSRYERDLRRRRRPAVAPGDVSRSCARSSSSTAASARALARPPARTALPFVSLRSGMGALVDALRRASSARRSVTGRSVVRLVRRAGGSTSSSPAARRSRPNGVVLATPAYVTAEVVAALDRSSPRRTRRSRTPRPSS